MCSESRNSPNLQPSRGYRSAAKWVSSFVTGRLFVATAVVGLVGCASAPNTVPEVSSFAPDQPTTADVVSYLIKEELTYRLARANAERRLAQAEAELSKLAGRLPNSSDALVLGFQKGQAESRIGEAADEIAELDQNWHSLLSEMLGGAPTAEDFELRAAALSLTSEEAAPFRALFRSAPKHQ